MPKYRLTLEVKAENEEEAMLDYNENIPEFEDFSIEEITDEE